MTLGGLVGVVVPPFLRRVQLGKNDDLSLGLSGCGRLFLHGARLLFFLSCAQVAEGSGECQGLNIAEFSERRERVVQMESRNFYAQTGV